ncbi:hypothetical protein CRYUN_Cryun16bG0022500 [Craigia yunnanensis]
MNKRIDSTMDPKLYETSASGDIDFLKRMDRNLDVFQVTKQQKNTVLHIAVKFKQLEFCRLRERATGEVESWGVNVIREMLRMVNLEKDTALHLAVRNGHFEVAKFLMEADQVLWGLVNNANASPFCLVIEGGFFRIANFIPEMFPQSIDGDINIKTALHSAVIHSQHALYGELKSTQRLLQGNSSTAYIVDQYGTSALHVAAFRGHINVVELLVQCFLIFMR